MKIGLAQIKSVKGDIAHNLAHHLALLNRLSPGEADLVMFPELSLTNYDPDIAESVALEPDDPQLGLLQDFADKTGVAVGVGLPTKTGQKPRISTMDPSRQRLSAKALQFGIPILVANSVGTCEGKVAGGRSMVIGADGTVACSLNSHEEAMLFYAMDENKGYKVPIQSP